MTNPEKPVPVSEPSIWDYFVSRLKFWSREERPEPIQTTDTTDTSETPKPKPEHEAKPEKKAGFPWLTVMALGLALVAQLTLEPSAGRTAWPGVVLYAGALGCLVAGLIRKEWHLPDPKPDAEETLSMAVKTQYLLIGVVLAAFAFVLFGSGEFGFLNTTLWILSLVFIFMAFRQKQPRKSFSFKSLWAQLKAGGWQIPITRWTLVVLAVIAVILFFNFHRLDSVPPEMVSDQAEKLLDINDILNGMRSVYFTRNTGREVLHFYLTAAYMAIFNLEVSFLNLKTVAVFANLVTLIFIYMLGREVGNKRVGLAAALFAGIAYWPLLFTRLALRIPYYPLFVAPVMYFMIRGLRRQNINDILVTGLFLGLGLHGYTPFRIVPIFVVIGILIFVLHRSARNKRLEALYALLLIAFVSVVVFIPLLRFWVSNPQLFAYRAFSRLTGMEVGFQEAPIVIFFKNFWKASIMFFWDNGTIWAHSVPSRPALEVVSGALYFLGIAALLIRYIRKRNWVDLFLLVSIPMMMMPSILSLAYPNENPCLNRTAGAVVPVFVVIGMAFETIFRSVRSRLEGRIGKTLLATAVLLLVLWSGANNYDLVFNQYYTIYRSSAWNTTELGEVAELFIDTWGTPETTYVVGYPHWVDSRLVAINAGYAGYDFAILPENIPASGETPGAKLFFVNVNDGENMQLLLETYPYGILTQNESAVANKDFMTFFVPPNEGVTP